MFSLPNLPYPYGALEPYIDESTMQIHHDKHHAAYVNNLNDVLVGYERFASLTVQELLRQLNDVPQEIRTKVRNSAGGHANHSLFWQIMAPKAGGLPRGALAGAIDSAFGNFSRFQEAFTKAALGRFGSGWAWLVADGGKLVITDTANQDTPESDGKTVILTLDVWEHAYYLKYQNRRAEYIKNWWNVVNWAQAEHRFEGINTHV